MNSYTITLDIGFRFTGVVVYCHERKRIIRTECIKNDKITTDSKAQSHFEECQYLSNKLTGLLDHYPDRRVIVESPTGGGKSSIAVKSMASCVAVLASLCASLRIPVTLVTPLQIKRLVRGKGAVDKNEVMRLVEEKLTPIGFKYPNKYKWCKDHVADSAAILLVADQLGLLKLELNQTDK